MQDYSEETYEIKHFEGLSIDGRIIMWIFKI
jgi:hypothetical protein